MAPEQKSSIPTNAVLLFIGAIFVCLVGYFVRFGGFLFYLFLGLEALGLFFLVRAIFARASLDEDKRPPLKFPVLAAVITLVVVGGLFLLGRAFLDGLGKAYGL